MIPTTQIGLMSKVVFNPNQLGEGERRLVTDLHERNKHRYPLTIYEISGATVPSLKDEAGNPVYTTGCRSNHTVFELRWLKLWENE